MEAHLQPAAAMAAPAVFDIEIVKPDGTADRYQRVGGTSIEHSMHAIERAGIGGVVRVRRAVILVDDSDDCDSEGGLE
jgi:hypothetical protein